MQYNYLVTVKLPLSSGYAIYGNHCLYVWPEKLALNVFGVLAPPAGGDVLT